MKFSVLLTVLALNNFIKPFYCVGMKIAFADPTKNLIFRDIITMEFLEFFSYPHSPVDLLYLTMVEEDLYAIVKEYISKLNKEPEYFFKRYIADYEESTLVAFNDWNSTNGEEKRFLIPANPIWTYRMIWRYVTDFPEIKNVILSSGYSEILEKYKATVNEHFVFPDENDLNVSMGNLLNLQDVYDLNLTELADGIIANVTTNASLSAIHCYEIAKFALWNSSQYTLAVDWLGIAYRKSLNVGADAHPILDYLEDDAINNLMGEVIKEHDENWVEEMRNKFNQYQFVDKIDSDFILLPLKKLLQRVYNRRGDAKPKLSLNDATAFSTLCKGGNLQSEKEKSELYCWYESKINPAWYINPQKMELVSKDPYVTQVYDFIGDDLINYLKRTAIPVMERRPHLKNATDLIRKERRKDLMNSLFRTPFYSWADEHEYELKLPALNQRIGYLTGLTTSYSAITLQISIYATGGYFNIHVDSEGHSERLATFMLYLNDVELGGKTVFTSSGVSVPPVKGSAVFWYVSKRNGEVDYKHWHAGCPVLLGEKWIGTKWINKNPNMFHRKCTQDKNE